MKRLTVGDGGCKAGALILRRRKLELPPSEEVFRQEQNVGRKERISQLLTCRRYVI